MACLRVNISVELDRRLRQEELELKAIEVAPAWSQYDHNEDFWKLVERMERIANENGFPDLKDNIKN